MIPKIIHYIWFNFYDQFKESKMPWRYRKQQELLKKINQDYEFMLWTDSSALEMMNKHYPQYVKQYTKLKQPIERVDVFKYFLMHLYGGIYLDADMIAKKPLYLFFKNLKRDYDIILSRENRYIIDNISLSNCILMSKPNEQFWMDVIHYIFNWKITYTASLDNHMYILEKTGPIMLHNVYNSKRENRKKIYLAPAIYFMTNNPKCYLYHTSDKTWMSPHVYKNLAIAVSASSVIIYLLYYLSYYLFFYVLCGIINKIINGVSIVNI